LFIKERGEIEESWHNIACKRRHKRGSSRGMAATAICQ
jgi:hypothetical protein